MAISRGSISYTAQDDSEAIVALGAKVDDTYATDASVTTAVDAAKAAVKAAAHVVSIDGADETTPPGEVYAVTGMTANSVVVSVVHVSTKASVASMDVLDPADFTPGADSLTSLDETDRTNDQLLVTYFD